MVSSVFGRKKKDEADQAQLVHPERPGAKNRPTPRRSVQEAANKRPLVVTDRKAAAAADRARRREAMVLQRQAMATGDDRHLPPRDKGPVRRFVRDYVDSRLMVAEYMLPMMIVVLPLSLLQTTWAWVPLVVVSLLYGFLLVSGLHTWFVLRGMRRQIAAKFGPQAPREKGLGWYAVMRAYQLRRLRMPKPQVARGEKIT